MNFKRCADFGADDGETVTILKRLVAWAYLFGPRFWKAVQPKNICVNRTSWEFGKCTNVEIQKCINVSVMNSGTEEDLMKVKEFTDDKTEMAGVVAEPKVSGSLRRMRACEEECDVWSSLPRSVSAESEFHTGVKGESPRTKNTLIDAVKMLRDVFLMRANYVCVSAA